MPVIRTISKPSLTAARFLSFLFTIVVWLAPGLAVCQNLVPNGSFEEGVDGGCPTHFGNLHEECADWYASIQNPNFEDNEQLTPDWFHECSELSEMSPPSVTFGYQIPADGEGYAGIITYLANPNSYPGWERYRENIGVELSQSMEFGQTYLVEFKIARLFAASTTLASDGLGFRFTTHATFPSREAATDNFSHFSVDTIFTDTTNWLNISEIFIADSTYSYFHIGNFYDDSTTSVIYEVENDVGPYAYYIIDQVKINIVLNSTSSANTNSIFKLYPNPFTDNVYIENLNNERINNITIHNSIGNTVYSDGNVLNNIINLSRLASGIYFCEIQTEKTTYYERIVKLD